MIAIGHGSAPITVPVGTPMGGYAQRTGPSTDTLDPLEMHAVSFSAGERRFVWLVGDLPAVNTDLADVVSTRLSALLPGVTPELVWLGATHTHSGPETGCHPGGSTTPADRLTGLVDAAVEAATDAVREEIPTELRLHHGSLTDVAGQRSGTHPRLDVPVSLLAARRPNGALDGLLVILPVHPTVLGAENRLLSADLAGAVRRNLLQAEGRATQERPRWAMVATGAAGDVSTRAHRRAQTPAELDRLGALAANQLLALSATDGIPLSAPPTTSPESKSSTAVSIPLSGSATIAGLPSRADDPEVDTTAASERLAIARAAGDSVAIREAETALLGASLATTARPARPELAIAAVRLGPLRLVAFGAEPYLALSDAIARDLNGPTVLAGYTNGYLGYLPTRDAYDTGVYEAYISPVPAGAAETAVEIATTMARSL